MSSVSPAPRIPSALLVDDQEVMRQLLSSMLPYVGYVVAGEAENGLEAVEKTRELHPDFLIVDLAMPIMDGLEAIRRIRAERDVPIVICSGLSDPALKEKALALGARGFLLKPFSLPQLQATIAECLEGVAVEDSKTPCAA